MLRELFRIPVLDWPVFGYGLMLVLGLLGAISLARFLARRSGLNPDDFSTAGVLALLSGVIGARISHVLENLGTYTDPSRGLWENLLAAINIRSGGLTYYGGFMLATAVLLIWGWRKKIPLRTGMDVVAPALMVGLAMGRVGCLLNGCCWGGVCESGFGIRFPFGSPVYQSEFVEGRVDPPAELVRPTGQGRARLLEPDELRNQPDLQALARQQWSSPRHPTQIYSAALALLIAGTCVAYFTLAPPPGRVFALMLVLEGAGRFVIETLRVEPAVLWNLSYSMVIALHLIAAGVACWWYFSRRPVQGARPASASG